MAITALCLILLVHLPSIFGSGSFLQSQDCGDDHIDYSSFHGDELFYINGNEANRVLFCKALQFYHANGCNIKDYLGSTICGLDLSSVTLPSKEGRKLLVKDLRDESAFHHQKSVTKYPSTPRAVIIASGVMFACCALLCPCVYRKRKATTHVVLNKELNSMDSASSFDVQSASEKIPASPLRVPPSPSRFTMSPKLSRLGSVHLNMSQIARATRNFSSALQIGEGGFGTVYKAHLEDGQIVAIKRAKKENFENLQTEFSSEVELLAKIDHRNLVKLLGYVNKGNERLIITEYVPNGTLREHLDGQRGRILDFNQRLEIAIDIAHGLTYLHLYAEKPIIHRDVKSSNILLTESMRAKVADFGFARLGTLDSDQTHISTKVKGTVGYLDPEYMKTYQLTTKSDVYSFGILLLEILTGRRPVELKRPVEERVTLRWAFTKYREATVVELVDPLMEETVNASVLVKFVDLAFQCAAPIRADRPDMMSVQQQLWAIRADYHKKGKRG
ncbi:Kinase family protein [Quillaja saponaria]|uniref:non-specific serine/threonine protein kinase n=1 Tax=Quillaja saponaria TaxID=32244 RepID=A0AAD7VKI1_QUISA|nr:Kinase family protein [Quillaja saponaria]KAJ7979000.1 Kinase family protein [Quillaja saponaria]